MQKKNANKQLSNYIQIHFSILLTYWNEFYKRHLSLQQHKGVCALVCIHVCVPDIIVLDLDSVIQLSVTTQYFHTGPVENIYNPLHMWLIKGCCQNSVSESLNSTDK